MDGAPLHPDLGRL
jgi:hypothetical protein